MSVRRAMFWLLPVIGLQGGATLAETPKALASPTLALIGDEMVTEAEVDALVGPQLAELRQKTFQLRSQGLDELIAQRLAEREAKRRGITLEALLKAEVDDKVVFTDADLKALYEANKARFTGQSEAEAMKQVEPAVRQQKRRERQMALVRELRAAARVTVLLEPMRAELHLPAGAPARGPEKAPITIVEFSDFQCPYCVRAQPTLKRVRTTYGDNVRFVFVDFPLDIHPQAKKAHEAAACAHEQGKFWPMSTGCSRARASSRSPTSRDTPRKPASTPPPSTPVSIRAATPMPANGGWKRVRATASPAPRPSSSTAGWWWERSPTRPSRRSSMTSWIGGPRPRRVPRLGNPDREHLGETPAIGRRRNAFSPFRFRNSYDGPEDGTSREKGVKFVWRSK